MIELLAGSLMGVASYYVAKRLDIGSILRRKTIKTKVVGVTFEGRQDVIRGYLKPWSRLVLIREPFNPFDPYAIGVWIDDASRQIGYLSREVAFSLRDARKIRVRKFRRTGDRMPYAGVNIEIAYQ